VNCKGDVNVCELSIGYDIVLVNGRSHARTEWAKK